MMTKVDLHSMLASILWSIGQSYVTFSSMVRLLCQRSACDRRPSQGVFWRTSSVMIGASVYRQLSRNTESSGDRNPLIPATERSV
jgi:hypothetical protein